MNDIFEEINQDVQQEKLVKFWEKHKKTLSSLATGIVVIAAIIAYWLYRQQEIREEASADYTVALLLLSTQQPEKALRHLESMPQKDGHIYADLAKFLGANIQLSQGNTEAAREAYEAVIKDTSHKELRDLATIKSLSLLLDMGQAEEVLVKLRPYLNASSPWRYIAQELQAVALLKQEKTDEAKEVLSTLKGEKDAPESLKWRAGFLLSHLKQQ